MRGEYFNKTEVSKAYMELPPRARRIRRAMMKPMMNDGTTSACAENTNRPPQHSRRGGNYLRVRGEYCRGVFRIRGYRELPPRARRIQTLISGCHRRMGTTSACAENTSHAPSNHPPPRNYLRVRGEYHLYSIFLLENLELPPRARRIPHHPAPGHCQIGTTSACAENTAKR